MFRYSRNVLVCLILLSSLIVSASVFSAVREYTYGNEGKSDGARYVEQTSTGYLVMTGYTENESGNWDLFVKLVNPSNGNTLWTYTYDGTEEKEDVGYCVRENHDGDFIVVGAANCPSQDQDANEDILVILVNSSGVEKWAEEYDIEGGRGGAAYVIEVTDDKYVFCGTKNADGYWRATAFLWKLHDEGSQRVTDWCRVYEPPDSVGMSWFSGVQELDGGGFIAAGTGYKTVEDSTYGGIFVVFTDSSGLNEEKYFTTDPDDDHDRKYEGRYLSEQIDDGYVITGLTCEPDEDWMDAFMWRIPEDYDGGVTVDYDFYQEYGDFFHSAAHEYHDFGWSVHGYTENSEQYYALSGYTSVDHGAVGSRDAMLLSADEDGDCNWVCHFGETWGVGASDVGYSVDVLANGDFAVAGRTIDGPLNPDQDIYLIITDGGSDESECEDCSP